MRVYKSFYSVAFLVYIFAACSTAPLKPIDINSTKLTVSFLKDVKPILEKRCTSCHSCYNSPCQLKLSSYEGIDRGSSKDLVYLAERLRAQDPTRLFIDAKSTQEWREKGFFSVIDSSSPLGTNNSIMLELLKHKMEHPKSVGIYKSEEKTTCAKNIDELAEFLDDNPHKGMPFGFPALSVNEYEIMKAWLGGGAKKSPKKSSSKPKILKKFEEFLNKDDAKHKMSARYIYEHLFLAHLSFSKDSKDYYELVRSYTQSPEPIDIIATIRPYDDPNVDKFYYRFRKITSTIVYKTHMVYDLNPKKLQRYKELFIEPKWNETPYDVGFKTKYNTQPFKVFEQIPAKSRYQFLLDNKEYVIRTFIRGPVCKGQIALNVIHDHFWVTFLKPEFDLSLRDNNFLKSQYDNLRMPIEYGSNMKVIKTFTDAYNDRAISYMKNRRDLYDSIYSQSLDKNSITGDILTIYRHYDSASVHKGALGNIPRTAWVIDYPLFERIYYALVAGFDVYGNIGHQVSIRRYMSRLRVEGESYFLNYLPLEDRQKEFNSWYLNSEDSEVVYLSKKKTSTVFIKNNSKREFLESFIKHFDEFNYKEVDERINMPKEFKVRKDYIMGFRSLIKEGTNFIRHVNGTNSNLAYIRIKNIPNQEDLVISAIVNRWHDNVSFMFDEESRLDDTKDELNFVNGFVGSYPNLFLVLEYKDLPDFLEMMHNYDGSQKYIDKFMKYAIFRSDDDFWEHFDWFVERFYKDNPHEAGLFDLNRYYYKAF